MKKFILSLSFLFIISTTFSQGWVESLQLFQKEFIQNLNGSLVSEQNTMVGNPNEWSKIMGVFYQFDDIRFDDRHLEGSIFLFDNEDHPGRVYIDNKVYKMENINYNIENDQFFTKIENDSVFIYTFETIDKISIKNREFKEIYDPYLNKESVFEIIYEGDNISLFKKHTVRFIAGSDNPMVNRSSSIFKQKQRYYIEQGKKISKLNLKKSSILNLFDTKSRIKVKDYIRDNKLSLKKEYDLKKLLYFCNTI